MKKDTEEETDRQEKVYGKKHGNDGRRKALSASFITGAIALVFLIVGYQAALFMNRAAQKKLGARHSVDTLYIMASPETSEAESAAGNAMHGATSKKTYDRPSDSATGQRKAGNGSGDRRSGTYGTAKRTAESFAFDPNTVSVEDLQRLGFSEKQAQSIENYRLKGGRFRRASDFARSYVVSDSMFARLEPYIDIPKTDLNTADSATFTDLPGIGSYFARKMVEYRKQLGGYSYKEQLMDIYHFDREKFAGLEDLICIDSASVIPYPLWTLSEDSLSLHPYIGSYAAHGIVLYREHNDMKDWTVEGLAKAGILRPGMAEKLARCRIANNL